MFKFIITLKLKPGSLETLREAAKPCQAATRAEEGCISYDFYTSIDDPDAMVFVECFKTREAHAWHSDQDYTQTFISIFQPLTVSLKRENIEIAD